MKTLLLIPLLLTSCAQGRYIGPSIGLKTGFMGAEVGFTIYGDNPATTGHPRLGGPLQVAIATPESAAVEAASTTRLAEDTALKHTEKP